MKTTKLIIMGIVLLTLTTTTSCEKTDWKCVCTYSGGGKEEIELEGKMKRSEAKALCEGPQFNMPSQGINCSLK